MYVVVKRYDVVTTTVIISSAAAAPSAEQAEGFQKWESVEHAVESLCGDTSWLFGAGELEGPPGIRKDKIQAVARHGAKVWMPWLRLLSVIVDPSGGEERRAAAVDKHYHNLC